MAHLSLLIQESSRDGRKKKEKNEGRDDIRPRWVGMLAVPVWGLDPAEDGRVKRNYLLDQNTMLSGI